MSDMDEEEGIDLVEFLENEDDFPQCCFCEHEYLSEACRGCPVREDNMPDEIEEEG